MECDLDFESSPYNSLCSKTISTSSEILRYFTTYCEGKKKGFDKLNPRDYMKLLLSTVVVLNVLRDEIKELTLNLEQKLALDVFKKYAYKELMGDYEKNYLKFSLWRKNDILRYSIDKYNIHLEDKNKNWKKIYAIPVPNYTHMNTIGAVILRVANKLGVFDF
ncbi:hypothetical protein MmarC5_1295 [Methanococcus maripaludis C5]|uniref:Uncharacterized protein n=1 Tax=Methanococcus maripaludis (strain C5 / ATCC BAA-1333) TaxID=402880 RepID=A4FZF9_METM5|nr:hypothetical protein [Methanococcus maripaludis]ABO35593.1 hypothetical protein MmarC5_1295 [Methanococcus maripaludis C5]